MRQRTTVIGLLGAMLASSFLVGSCDASDDAQKPITDKELLAYSHSSFDKRSKEGAHEVLGWHQKALVVADFPCSDMCPDATTRVIHYDVPADPKICTGVGGVIRNEWVPIGDAVGPKAFCLPKILAAAEAAEARRYEAAHHGETILD